MLSPREIRSIIAYLVTLAPGGIPIPDVDVASGSLSDGERVYQLDCAPCHGTTGNGGAVGTRSAPNLRSATPIQIAEAVRVGPTTMPLFGPSTITQDDLNSLVRYVLYLRNPDDPGGASLGRVGPLLEGFFALVVGLGALIVATRMIGERTER